MNQASKIVDLIVAAGHSWPGGRDNAKIVRTRAGRNQRAAGAWSWFLITVDGYTPYPSVGSQVGITELLKSTVDVSWDKHTRSIVLDPK